MNIKRVINYIGAMVIVEGLLMLLPFIVSLIYGERNGIYFIQCAILLLIVGVILQRFFKSDERFYSAEGFVTVALGWIILSICGALPFFISKEIPSFVDSVFEIH